MSLRSNSLGFTWWQTARSWHEACIVSEDCCIGCTCGAAGKHLPAWSFQESLPPVATGVFVQVVTRS